MRLRLGSKFSATDILVLAQLGFLAATTLATSPGGFSDYIRAGLGLAQASDRADTSGNSTNPDQNALADLASCATSWAAYSSQLSSFALNTTSSTTSYSAWSTSLVSGTGDVYTTSAGIPVASGNFTPTRTVSTVYNITSSQTFTYTTTDAPTNTPKCSFTPQDCSRLYVSYLSSLGLSANASIPSITPAPSNSPPCPAYYYKPLSTCTWSSAHNYANGCHIYGNSVQLFYFPTATANQSTSSPDPTAPPRIYSWAPGVTFTSPSVYLSFDYLSAERIINNNNDYRCTTCDQAGCRQAAVDGGQEIKSEGTSIPGQLITMAPGEVQSVVMDYSGANASSIVNVMAHGLPDYSSVMDDFFGHSLASKVAYRSLRFEDISHPPPEAYYLQPTPASGCNFTSPDVQCSTIFEGQYRALISLPSEVTGLQGPWRTCTPVIYGVYDPPLALTEASYAAGVTMPHGGAPTEYNTHKSEAPAAAPTPPDITVPRTAPASPQATGAGRIPPAESAVLPSGSGSSDTDGNGSGGSDGSNSGSSGSGSNGNGSGDNGASGGNDSNDSGANGNGSGDNGSNDNGSNDDGSNGQGSHGGSGQGNDSSGSGSGSGSGSQSSGGSQSDDGSQSAGQGSNDGNGNSGGSNPNASASGSNNGDSDQSDGSNSGQSSGTRTPTGAGASATGTSAASSAFESRWNWSLLAVFGLVHFAIT